MFDRFQGIEIVNLHPLTFQSKRYEVWAGGKLVDAKKLSSAIQIRSLDPLPNSRFIPVELTIAPNALASDLLDNLKFDIAYTSGDRIVIATIPEKSNIEDLNNYVVFKSFAPTRTRLEKIFKEAEPYAGSLFFTDGMLQKITFSVERRGKLIEFYLD